MKKVLALVFCFFLLTGDDVEASNTHSLNFIESSDQYVYISDNDHTGLDITGDISIEAWIKLEQLPSSIGDYTVLVIKDDSLSNRSFGMGMTTQNELYFQFTDGVNWTAAEGFSPTFTENDLGEWIHVAATADVSEGFDGVKLYRDGVEMTKELQANQAYSINDSEASLYVGGSPDFNQYFDGQLDEVRIWDDVRSQAEIIEKRCEILDGDESNLHAYWQLNSSYLDSTSNNNDLVDNNSPVYVEDVPECFTESEGSREGLYTQIESQYPSEEETAEWAGEDYAGGQSYYCGSTIAECGCAITSLVMAGRDFGITTDVLGDDVNPLNMNEYLESVDGYLNNGGVWWSAGQAYLSELTPEGLYSKLAWDAIYNTNSTSTLDTKLTEGNHVVLGFSNVENGHFVWLADKTENSYVVFDPYWYNTMVANEAEASDTVQTYDNTFESLRVYDVLPESQKVDASAEAYLTGTAELLFTKATGEKVGYEDGTVVIDLERSSYGEEGIISLTENIQEDNKHLLVSSAGDVFTLSVLGKGIGDYTLEMFTISDNGTTQTFEFTGKTFPGITTNFEFNLETGEVTELPVSSSDLQLVIDELLEGATPQQRAFFEKWTEKVLSDLENKTLTQALQTISTYKKLFVAKKVYASKVDLLIDALLVE